MSQKSFSDSLRTLPIAHKVVAGCAVAVLAMGGFLFFQWVSTPSYAVLYTELDDQALSEVMMGSRLKVFHTRSRAADRQSWFPARWCIRPAPISPRPV